jgi:hypothetical protein
VVYVSCSKIVPCSKNLKSSAVRAELGIASLQARRMKLELKYWFDINARYGMERLHRAGTWKIAIQSSGKAPAGHNRILADRTFSALGLDKPEAERVVAQFRSNAIQEGYRNKDEERVALRREFEFDVKEAVFKHERKAWITDLSAPKFAFLRTSIQDKTSLSQEPWFESCDYGALLKFRLRTSSLGLGIVREGGIPRDALCPMCKGVETTLHFLISCPGYQAERKLIRGQIPSLPKEAQALMSTLLRSSHDNKKWERRIQQFLVKCWKKRGSALGLSEVDPQPVPVPVRPQALVWQPSLHSFFGKQHVDYSNRRSSQPRRGSASSPRVTGGVNGNYSATA